MGDLLLSPFQLEIIRQSLLSDKNIVVDATAGSGKTTTILQIVSSLPRDLNYIVVAFNKKIAQELRSRCNSPVKISTIHSLGYTYLKNNYKVNNNLLLNMLTKSLDFSKAIQVIDAYNLLRHNDLDIDIFSFEHIIDHYSLPIDLETIDKVLNVIIDNSPLYSQVSYIDFTDMIYLPHRLNLTKPIYDLIIIDEAQDLSKTQHRLLFSVLKNKGRFIAVGDSYQSIYGFSGASPEIFNSLKQKQNTITLPLHVSYRCPEKIVKEAKKYCPHIKSHKKGGGVKKITKINKFLSLVQPNDMVLCRINAPLISIHYHILKKGKKSFVLGEDMELELKKLLDKIQGYTKFEMIESAKKLLKHETQSIDNLPISDKSKQIRKFEITDKITALCVIIRRTQNRRQVVRDISKIFKKGDGVVLSTIHKAKGLECDNVFLLQSWDGQSTWRDDLIDSEWEEEQERNVKFVATTRAKKTLNYIHL